ncbi:DtxR family iron (metal) dependent repressor [Hungatella effluvii]|uniref:DtxR family iron (Metal) dependent repressor n=1 Tax=Hungatella effluvii TaxID=1096246 RepID=A0A2V3Y3P0_9FIRM|nr:metal-dependent transcriptional regulator [Hungatella effluvii]PXX52982.1 DtxR family iron (metal) dependent repressor [Hungatella effluvii]
MALTMSRENYLKIIYILKKANGEVRSIDIANYMELSKPSVCAAVKQLQTQGYIIKAGNGIIELTDRGRSEAERVFERHCFFEEKLIAAGVSPEQAHADAARLEHAVSNESFNALKKAGLPAGS